MVGALAVLALLRPPDASPGLMASLASTPGPAADPLALQVNEIMETLRAKAAVPAGENEALKSIGPVIDRLLDIAGDDVAAGRHYAALERMADANRYLGGIAFSNAHQGMSPCRSTLGWLGDLASAHPDDLAVLAFAVESDEDGVRRMTAVSRPGPAFAIGTPEIALAFGDLVSVPTLFIFDRDGRNARVFYGTPPDLHDSAGRVVDRLIDGP